MNRYSLIFALLMATSLAVHSPGPQAPASSGSGGGESGVSRARASEVAQGATISAGPNSKSAPAENASRLSAPLGLIQKFLSNVDSVPHPIQSMKVLFVTVPHPIETHLASAFDHNVEALQDGIQSAGYVYDSSYIPWKKHEPRTSFEDDEKEKSNRRDEDALPGILLFRQSGRVADTYSHGLLVFLFTEKPTQGITIDQVPNAISILRSSDISLMGPIRFLGPSYTGSLASLVSVIKVLHQPNPNAHVLIRSGSVSGGVPAASTVEEIAREFPGTRIDFGSAQPDNSQWTLAALEALARIGIPQGSVATLSENESLFGHISLVKVGASGKEESTGMWSLNFPRDISSLRAGYQKQGIFQSRSVTQPWNKVLELNSSDESEGDTVKSFGGPATIAVQESILLGISEFLKKHAVRAVIIIATNEEDRYFLSEFIHAHNSDVRIVVVGATRVFMRGSTSIFRGDLLVDNLPLLPRLHDWTRGNQDFPAHVFANDTSQGTYFAAIDLLADPPVAGENSYGPGLISGRSGLLKWFPEYSELKWSTDEAPMRFPPMHVVALGGNLTWPVSESGEGQFRKGDNDHWIVEMPFTLFGRIPKEQLDSPLAPSPIRTALTWMMLFSLLILCTVAYCACFLYANSVNRTLFASFEPSGRWRYWLFKVALPAGLFGCAFRVLSWTNEMPGSVSQSVLAWGTAAEMMTILAPLAIAVSAVGKRIVGPPPRWNGWMLLAVVPVIIHAIAFFTTGYSESPPFARLGVGSILTHYREMHWESGLSLVPTVLLFLTALFVWTTQAGDGAAILETVPVLPDYPDYERISNERGASILSVARPLPPFHRTKWMWLMWIAAGAAIVLAHSYFPPYRRITTLESLGITRLLLKVSMSIVLLMLLDVLQFLWLWNEIRGLLQSLDKQIFKRSFVPIKNFPWNNLWSFTGISFGDRAEIEAAQVDCILDLALKYRIHSFLRYARILKRLRNRYTRVSIAPLSPQKRRYNRALFYSLVQAAGNHAATLVENQRYMLLSPTSPQGKQSSDSGRFQEEEEELAQLPDWQRTAEKLLCLIYISFIQTIVARFRTLLISVASLFSLVTLGFAIYPFAPLFPLLVSGIVLIGFIAWAFYKVFSEMDTDRTLSRIVNGDDRKLEKHFYVKFAESLALPLLTLGSSFLPGGAGRLLEMVQTLFSHAG
jgi:hypothetical protein